VEASAASLNCMPRKADARATRARTRRGPRDALGLRSAAGGTRGGHCLTQRGGYSTRYSNRGDPDAASRPAVPGTWRVWPRSTGLLIVRIEGVRGSHPLSSTNKSGAASDANASRSASYSS
jgi:hypothetical protein